MTVARRVGLLVALLVLLAACAPGPENPHHDPGFLPDHGVDLSGWDAS